MEINIHQAKTHFSKLLQRVACGEEIIIAKAGVPVARLVPVETGKKVHKLGLGRGTLKIAADFDAPLPAEIMNSFYGGKSRKKSR